MKHLSCLTVTAVALVLIFTGVAAFADDAQTLAKIDAQLARLKTFEYGQDQNPIRELQQTVFQIPADSPLRGTVEQKLVDALGDSNAVGRGMICRQLRVIGTDKCVPAVAAMLTDEKLSHFARYALEGLGSDAALKAMHEAVGKTSGAVQIGLLNSLSNRDYQPLRADCVRLLGSDDAAVASSAARALGRLGGKESVAALTGAKAQAKGQLALDIDLALLNCAEMLLTSGDAQSAAEIYAEYYKPESPFRLAGLRGLVVAEPEKAADLLVGAMGDDDRQLVASAIALTSQVQGAAATAKFVGLLDTLPAEEKVLMIKALGARGDEAAAGAVAKATGSDDQNVRLAAIEALGGLSGPAAFDTLLKAAAHGDDSCRRVARAALTRIEGADSRLAEAAKGSDDELGIEAIRALAARLASDQTKLMLELAKGDASAKRAAAIEALGVLAGADDLESLVQLAAGSRTPGDRVIIEESLSRVLARIESPADRAAPLLNGLSGASAEVRPVLIRQLGKAGTPEALAVVRKALESSDAAESDAAVAALADWPGAEVSDDLIGLIESARTPELKATALKGALRIASESDNPSAMFLDYLKKVDSADDKKRILKEIGLKCESVEAAKAMQSLLDDRRLQGTAGIAAVRIAYKLRLNHMDHAREILQDVLAKVDHPDVRKRAQGVLNDFDKYEDHIMDWVAIGPFVDEKIVSGEQSYATKFDPEKKDTSDLKWKPLTLGKGSWDINLEATYGSVDHCAAYVRTMVFSPVDQDVQVEGGCDDALKIWVNGELVFENYRVGGSSPRTMIASARLHQGWNELKLKAVDHEGGWVFGCRIRKPDGTKLEGLKYEAR